MNFLLNFFLWRHLRKWSKKTSTQLDDDAIELLKANISRIINLELTPKDGAMKLLEDGLQLLICHWNTHRNDEKARAFLIKIQELICSLDLNEK